ncbi:hypothetical protein TWF788_001995 [Orbilia oligospora]|uniref:ER-bound oxygenase mpaB/mpaB'/Rubber oxygenase catalytic domain-containing protein n=1 Tax=Orbilia oligospora TaxID=2813651 RepID=A0A7C8K5N8_ORBOL|nr:hypothetical protein TWF788_001995 [Orbilia oligospora]
MFLNYWPYGIALAAYLLTVRFFRYRRRNEITAKFSGIGRPLSKMTGSEAHEIMAILQEFEFPYAFQKARTISLLKAGGIPTMSKLFAVTGQNTRRNAGKRAVDTEILLREVHHNGRDTDRYMKAVSRMNYLHARYRKAGKILDDDMLHTLGSGIVESFRIVDTEEWRQLSKEEKCAIGIFHKALGEDLGIPWTSLPSHREGWEDGAHFATELRDWTVGYESRVARFTGTNDQYVRVYVDSATSAMPRFFTTLLRKVIGYELDDVMRSTLGLEKAGILLRVIITSTKTIRKILLRHFTFPRRSPVKVLHEKPNPKTGLFNFFPTGLQPWYVKKDIWSIWGPSALFVRALGGRLPGSHGDRFHPQGYDLTTIGPKPQEGRGLENMAATMEFLRARNISGCPFQKGYGEKGETQATPIF